MNPIRIATRKSKLALWQANWVKERLQAAGLSAELIGIETIGDKQLDTSISKIGSKGVFTQELEDQLSTGATDIAVHSAKDLASTLPGGFEIIAYGLREYVSDVVVSSKEISLEQPLVIGTSSTRRVAQLAKYFSHFETVAIRGNLQTRIEKLKQGACEALLLARAGVERLGLSSMIRYEFPLDQLTPAVGQGCIAIEAHASLDSDTRQLIRKAVNDSETERVLVAERSFLKTLEGGCSIPAFANGELRGKEIYLTGGILSLDGQQFISKKGIGENGLALGNQVATDVLTSGGDLILVEIKKQLQ